MNERERITVVLSTRDRASAAPDAVRSILENDHGNFEIVVVDQSEDGQTEASLDEFMSDPRVRYFKSLSRGRAAGQNAGIREARGALVLLTDDDCRVPSDWLRQFEAAFQVDDRIGVVFGNVLPGPQDPDVGCIPAYTRETPFLARGIQDKHRVEGLGACMAVKHCVWKSLGGFDEMLGSGSRFKAGEEGDLAMRALFAGHWIYETPAVWVTHFGLRKWDQLPALIDGYWYGTGAMVVKAFKTRPWQALPFLLRLAVGWVLGRSVVGASLGRQPGRLTKLRSFCKGFAAGAAVAVNKEPCLYVGPSPSCERCE